MLALCCRATFSSHMHVLQRTHGMSPIRCKGGGSFILLALLSFYVSHPAHPFWRYFGDAQVFFLQDGVERLVTLELGLVHFATPCWIVHVGISLFDPRFLLFPVPIQEGFIVLRNYSIALTSSLGALDLLRCAILVPWRRL